MDSDDPTIDAPESPLAINSVSESQPIVFPENSPTPPNTGSSGRCLGYGCAVVFICGLFLILCAGFSTYFYFTKQVKTFTSDTPQEVSSVEYDEEKLVELDLRLQKFEQALEPAPDQAEVAPDVAPEVSEAPVEPKPRQLVLSAADLNRLIARQPQLRNKLLVKIQDGVISGDLSLPLDNLIPGGKGRFFNGSGSFTVTLQHGVLHVNLVDAAVNEQPIPPVVLSEIRKQNLAADFQNDPKASRTIQKFDRIEVKDDRIILTLKESEAAVADQKQ